MNKYPPIYRETFEYALHHHESKMWKESLNLNRDCARAIEKAIDDNYDGYYLGDCASGVIEQYAAERVLFVLAYTVQNKDHDGRFSQANKEWAKGFYFPHEDIVWDHTIESHPGLLNLFINEARKLCRTMENEMSAPTESSEDVLFDSADDPTEDSGMGGMT